MSFSKRTMRRSWRRTCGTKVVSIIYSKNGCQLTSTCSGVESWLPNRPNLNPLDYYFWNVVENVTNKTPYCCIPTQCHWSSIQKYEKRWFKEYVWALQDGGGHCKWRRLYTIILLLISAKITLFLIVNKFALK